jgi:hypothetical protein
LKFLFSFCFLLNVWCNSTLMCNAKVFMFLLLLFYIGIYYKSTSHHMSICLFSCKPCSSEHGVCCLANWKTLSSSLAFSNERWIQNFPLGKFECQCGFNLFTLLVFCDKVFVSSMAKEKKFYYPHLDAFRTSISNIDNMHLQRDNVSYDALFWSTKPYYQCIYNINLS